MLTLDGLRAIGANVDEGMARCMNMEAFYLRMVGMVLTEKHFDDLESAVNSKDPQGAFTALHNLKATTGNVGLTNVYEPVCEMTEALRGQTAWVDISAPYARMTQALRRQGR